MLRAVTLSLLVLSATASAAPTCSSLIIDGRMPAFTTAPYFASFNIDSSPDRSFFILNWSTPALRSAAAGLSGAPAHIRFGGTGNNALFYNFSGAPCTPSKDGHSLTCLNETTWDGVARVAQAAQAPIIFGVNMFPGGHAKNASQVFDPTNALQFFKRALERGDNIWGVELANELGPDSSKGMTAQAQAAGLLVLDAALAGLYGAGAPRPALIGPDPLGLHTPAPSGAPAYVPSVDVLAYLADFAAAVGPRLRAVTHHEYLEINATSCTDPSFLDLTYQMAVQVVAAVRAVSASVEVWAGEIGPHNGMGGPGDGRPGNCAGNLVCGRWGSALWYADAMAAKARAGYAAFCRQDLIGADYGLLNVSTLAPTPDYWLLALWQRTVGQRVLALSVGAGGDARLRAYSFCGRANGTATVLLINLAATDTLCVAPPALASPAAPRLQYVLTPVGGSSGSGVTAAGAALNGVTLALQADGALPPLEGVAVPATAPFSLPPLSITLATFATDADACGGAPP